VWRVEWLIVVKEAGDFIFVEEIVHGLTGGGRPGCMGHDWFTGFCNTPHWLDMD